MTIIPHGGHPSPPELPEQEGPRERPDFTWPESKLRQFLRTAWDQEWSTKIQVVGRIERGKDPAYGFLVDLHHPVSGTRLPSPVGNTDVHNRAFISPAELQRYATADDEQYALAELEFSSLQRRQERRDPLACMVRPGTLTQLREIPESWGTYTIRSLNLALIPDMALKTIEKQLKQDMADTKGKLETAKGKLADAKIEGKELAAALKKQRAELAKRETDHQTELAGQIEQVKQEIAARRAQMDELDAQAAARRSELESKLSELEALLREKGERMVALKLIDEVDLQRLLPVESGTHERPGHDFGEALAGDWTALAAYVQAHLWKQGMRYSRAQLLDFITLLRTNDLIVLAGDSGSGKTSMVKSVATAVGGHCTIVPVKPNWTSAEDLLGYYNPIEGRYHPTQFLLALLEAADEPEVPHFICLDEMNLARVEYYFADFLSLLETRGSDPWIHLYGATEERQATVDNRLFLTLAEEARKRAGLGANASLEQILLDDTANQELRRLAGFQEADTILSHHAKLRRSLAGLMTIPPEFRFPRNVWIIGAINVDETTHYLSPKVLDRAHVMRFRNPVLLDWTAMKVEVEKPDLDLTQPVKLAAADLGKRDPYPEFIPGDPDIAWLIELAREYLDPLGVEFGLRAIRQSIHYLDKAVEAGMDRVCALNNIVVHKILPKMVIEMDKATVTGEKRGDLLARMNDAISAKFADIDETRVVESAASCIGQLIRRAEGNHGIANFWAR